MRKFLFLVCLALLGCGSLSHFSVDLSANRPDSKTKKVSRYHVAGTAFFVNDTGLALTAAHTFLGQIPGTSKARLWWGPALVDLVAVDYAMDLALIQVDTGQSTPARPLCSQVQTGGGAIAIGLPDRVRVSRASGVIHHIDYERTPCKVLPTGSRDISVECAGDEEIFHVPDTRLRVPPPGWLVPIISGTAVIRPGFSGGTLLHKGVDGDPGDTCTAGVIIQMDRKARTVRAIHPSESREIFQYLEKHAPEFMRNFK